MSTKRILSPARMQVIQRAFTKWYEALDAPTQAMTSKLGRGTNDANEWKKGIRPIPIPMLIVLYRMTGDIGFLLTREEKAYYARRNPRYVIPRTARWPDLNDQTVPALPAPIPVPQPTPVVRASKQMTERASSVITAPTTITTAVGLRRELDRIVAFVEQFANLPSKHEERERARRHCISAGMRLFTALKKLGYEYPEDFEDILRQLGEVSLAFKTR